MRVRRNDDCPLNRKHCGLADNESNSKHTKIDDLAYLQIFVCLACLQPSQVLGVIELVKI